MSYHQIKLQEIVKDFQVYSVKGHKKVNSVCIGNLFTVEAIEIHHFPSNFHIQESHFRPPILSWSYHPSLFHKL